MQSIESHDRQIGELVERMDKTTANINALGINVHVLGTKVDSLGTKVDKLVETTQLNFRPAHSGDDGLNRARCRSSAAN